jgi:hypothetical protein
MDFLFLGNVEAPSWAPIVALPCPAPDRPSPFSISILPGFRSLFSLFDHRSPRRGKVIVLPGEC